MKTLLYFDRSYKIRPFGRASSQTQTLPPSRRVLLHTAPFYNIQGSRPVIGELLTQYTWYIFANRFLITVYRTRSVTAAPIIEKGLPQTRPAAKASALEALLLFIELDKPEPVIEELVAALSHKTPKVVAAALSALTSIYHNYGIKTVETKPVLKALAKVFGQAC